MVAMVAIDDKTRIASPHRRQRLTIRAPRPSVWNPCGPRLAATRSSSARMSPPLVSAKRDLAACDQCGKRRVGRALRGDAGLPCLVNVCRVGPPHPKRELHKLHKFPGVAPQPMAVARACWADGRPARRPRGVQGARHPPERAAASPPGARTARRPPQARRAARGRVLLVSFTGVIKNYQVRRGKTTGYVASP